MIAALAFLLGSDMLVATTVTVVFDGIDAGAEYMPFEIVPMFGTTDQVVAVLNPPVVFTVKCAVCCGESETVTGLNCILML